MATDSARLGFPHAPLTDEERKLLSARREMLTRIIQAARAEADAIDAAFFHAEPVARTDNGGRVLTDALLTSVLITYFKTNYLMLSGLPADRHLSLKELMNPLILPEGDQLLQATLQNETTRARFREYGPSRLSDESTRLTFVQWQQVMVALCRDV